MNGKEGVGIRSRGEFQVRATVKPRRLILESVLCMLGPAISPALGQEASFTGRSFDSLGLIDMPSARMDPDGALSFDADYFLNTQKYDLGFQALPWLNVRL